MSAALSALADALEAERLRPTPTRVEAARIRVRLDREAAIAPVSPADQARHRDELLAALRDSA